MFYNTGGNTSCLMALSFCIRSWSCTIPWWLPTFEVETGCQITNIRKRVCCVWPKISLQIVYFSGLYYVVSNLNPSDTHFGVSLFESQPGYGPSSPQSGHYSSCAIPDCNFLSLSPKYYPQHPTLDSRRASLSTTDHVSSPYRTAVTMIALSNLWKQR